jgi:hypothetical protein
MLKKRYFYLSILIFILSGCDVWFGYQPPIVPIRVQVDSTGDISLSVATSLATPIGVFDVGTGTSLKSIRNQYNARLLIIRVDSMAKIYELSEHEDFKVSFDDKNTLYKQVALEYQGGKKGDIVLELATVSGNGTIPDIEMISEIETYQDPAGCPGAPPIRLSIGMNAVVCTKSDPVYLRTVPKKSADHTHKLVPGADIQIIGGPVCDERVHWWYWEVKTVSGFTGWMAEGGDSRDPYFLCPGK